MNISTRALCDNPPMAMPRYGDGLRAARLIMVLSSMSPLFILWAIRGDSPIKDRYFIPFCAFMALAPNLFLYWRYLTAKRTSDTRTVRIGQYESRQQDVLAYLFAMLLPFYPNDLSAWRDFLATLAAFSLVVLLFWRLNLHYLNFWFSMLRFNVYAVQPSPDDNPLSGKDEVILITRRKVEEGLIVSPYRLSDTVLLEAPE